MLPTGFRGHLGSFSCRYSGSRHASNAVWLDLRSSPTCGNLASAPRCSAPTQIILHVFTSSVWMGPISVAVSAYNQRTGFRPFSRCICSPLRSFHSHLPAGVKQRPTKGKHREAPVGSNLVYMAKWDVYKRQQEKTVWRDSSGASGTLQAKALPRAGSEGPSRALALPEHCSARGQGSRRQNETGEQDHVLLLRRVWEQQGRLSPFQAADLAYFIARGKNPPEQLLQQLVFYVLHSQPERRLSVLRIHRLLRVFQLVPGVAERDVLGPLCGALQRRVSLLKPADLQLLLSDFSAVYTPEFLPFFSAAARVLKQCSREALDQPALAEKWAVQRAHGALEATTSGSNSGSSSIQRTNELENRKEPLSPVQACFLLHALGRTDFQDSSLFSLLIETVDGAVRQLLLYGQQQRRDNRLEASQGSSQKELLPDIENSEAHPRDAAALPLLGGLGPEAAELTGEALVMCAKGLANLNYKPTRAQLNRLVEVLVPYLLNEEPSVLGHAPSARRLPLLFGAVSGLTRLGAGPAGLCRLIEEACSQPMKLIGPYEPCDLLAAAAALEPVAAVPSHIAAVAVRTLEADLLQGMSPASAAQKLQELAVAAPETSAAVPTAATAGVARSDAVGTDAVGAKRDAIGDFRAGTVGENDTWTYVEDLRRRSGSPFRSAAHCYLLAAAVGLAGIRQFLFALHPAFRISTLSVLASLEALVPPAHRTPSKMPLGTAASVQPEQQQHQQEQPQQWQQQQPGPPASCSFVQPSASGDISTSGAAVGAPRQQTVDCSVKQGQHERANLGIIPSKSERTGRPPLHPVLRRLILSVFYRLPCISLRLLVELMEALRTCGFPQREQTEGLSPHGKSCRWRRPLMQALAREAIRKMHQATPNTLVTFLALFYLELDGFDVSLDPLIYGMQRFASLADQGALTETVALRLLLMEAMRKPEVAKAFSSFFPIASQLAEALLRRRLDSDPRQTDGYSEGVVRVLGSPGLCRSATSDCGAPYNVAK